MHLRTLLQAAAVVLVAAKAATTASRYSRTIRLANKTALVTGASRGLGRAIARELARKGCRVAICARSEQDLEHVRAELVALGATVHAEVCDLRSMAQVEELVANVTAHLGPIDILVANAATLSVGPIETMNLADFDEAIDSILKTSLHAALATLPGMRARRAGSIAFITSIGGKIGVPHLAPYSTAKFAVVGFAEALRAESAKDGINVLTVVPGLMRTGSHVHAMVKGDAEREYVWFGMGATAPAPMTIDAGRAARRIVRAIARGEREIVLTPAAKLAVATKGVAPGLIGLLARIAARLLPRAPGLPGEAGLRRREGADVERAAQGTAAALVRARGARLAAQNNQLKPAP